MRKPKLVRDNIPDLIKDRGQTCKTHVAENSEYAMKLAEKLQEEVDEFFKDGSIGELADVLEVIYAICEQKKIAVSDLETVRKQKLRRNGGFKKRLILDDY